MIQSFVFFSILSNYWLFIMLYSTYFYGVCATPFGNKKKSESFISFLRFIYLPSYFLKLDMLYILYDEEPLNPYNFILPYLFAR